jgi:L-ascorbate metabolism protein UlaG (beta-lactamase superfamily)
MKEARTMNRALLPAMILTTVVLLGVSGLLASHAAPVSTASAHPAMSQDSVTMEWLGWMFFRFTSPRGTVVLTSPWLENADSPLTLDELGRVDLILVPNGHSDDQGNALEIARRSGAQVIGPSPLIRWYVSNGLSAAQGLGGGIGSVFDVDGIHVRVVHNLHDNNNSLAPDGPYGGPAQGFIITFENGFTVYFAASSAIHTDMQLYGSLYQPHVALLNLGAGRDPMDLAHMARLLLTDNPNLQTVVPQHHRQGAPAVQQAATAIERLGLPVQLLDPVVARPYTFP